MSRALRDIPAIRALAEREAGKLWSAFVAASARNEALFVEPWGKLNERYQSRWTEGMLDLLTDLRRPASRDAVARLVAGAVGLECGATAPMLHLRDSWRPARWVVVGHHDEREFTHERPSGYIAPNPGSWFLIPALAGITDPAEALAIIADAVLP